MDRAYWDALAENYDSAIFSVQENDAEGLIAGHIARLANPKHLAADTCCW